MFISIGLDKQRRPRRNEAAPLKLANEWIERYRQFWEVRYDNLDSLLEEMLIETKVKATRKEKKK